MNMLRIIPKRPCFVVNAAAVCHGDGDLNGRGVGLQVPEEAGGVRGSEVSGCPVDSPAIPRMASEPDYKSVITDANLRRRMGRLLKMSVWCGLRALEGVAPESVSGIITSTGAGFMKDTISFGGSLFDREEELLNPSPFMQSTFNTASGYIALMRKIRSSNTAYVQGAAGFLSALTDSTMLLDEVPGSNVLIGGFDEVTPEVDTVRRRLGMYRDASGEFLPLGEGAGFFLLSDSCVSGSMARLYGMASATDAAEDFISDCGKVSGEDIRDVRTVRCSSLVARYGTFCSMLPVIIADRLGAGADSGTVLYVDDVNPDGPMALLGMAGSENRSCSR